MKHRIFSNRVAEPECFKSADPRWLHTNNASYLGVPAMKTRREISARLDCVLFLSHVMKMVNGCMRFPEEAATRAGVTGETGSFSKVQIIFIAS